MKFVTKINKNYIFLFILYLISSICYVLISSNLDNYNYIKNLPLISLTNKIISLTLISIIIFFFLHLSKKIRNKEFGVKLNKKIFLLFSVMTITSLSLNLLVTKYFLKNTVDSWFNPEIEKVFNNAFNIADQSLNYFSSELEKKAYISIYYINKFSNNENQIILNDLNNLLDLNCIKIYNQWGKLLITDNEFDQSYLPNNIPQDINQDLTNNLYYYKIIKDHSTNKFIFNFYLIYKNIIGQNRILGLSQTAPSFMQIDTENLLKSQKIYQKIFNYQTELSNIYINVIFNCVLLSIILAILVASYLSRYITFPLDNLIKNTKQIGEGSFTKYDKNIYGNDELSQLVKSFNEMTINLEKIRTQQSIDTNKITDYKNYLESLINNINSGIIVFKNDLEIISINHNFFDVLKLDTNNFNFKKISLLHPNLLELIESITINLNLKSWEKNLNIKLNDNKIINIFLKCVKFDYNNNLNLLIINDITNIVKAKQNEAWAEIAKRLAHEIKNPLTPIVLSAERLDLKLKPKLNLIDQKFLEKLVHQIILQVDELKLMVDKFRDFANINTPNLYKFNLLELIKQVILLYEQITYIKIRVVNCNNDIIVRGDQSMLRQVLHNLIKNAIEATEEQTDKLIEILVYQDDNYGYIKIHDNGSGFSTHVLNNIFNPYITTKGAKGSGLGLAIVKKIIDKHNGILEVYNDKGANIIFGIPLNY